ncbi:MAG: bacillithiol biosynthesis cysteine-adding enzyme BshC [Myxococcota bacterium]
MQPERRYSKTWYSDLVITLPTLPDFSDFTARRTAVLRADISHRTALVAALRITNAAYPPTEARTAGLDALAKDAACVVTGQQAGLFGGPLYTVHKTLSAIATAQALQEETGRSVVPIFWLQSEDHDFPEIDHVRLPTAPATTLSMTAAGDPSASVAHRMLENTAVEALGEALGTLPFATEVMDIVGRHYVHGRSVTDAFASMMAELFPEIVIVDPRHPAIAALTRATHLRALELAEPLSSALIRQSVALEESGATVQVHVRPGSPLAFFHPDGVHGARFRLDPTDDGFVLVGSSAGGEPRTVTREGLEAALADDPRSLSSSALLRPIIQDSLLPTAAYVGGPGEARYYAQLPECYRAFGFPAPMFITRARFRLVDVRTVDRVKRSGLSLDDLSMEWPRILESIGRSSRSDEDSDALTHRLMGGIIDQLTQFESEASELDPGLAKAAARTATTVEHAVGKLVSRYQRTVAQRDESTTAQIERARELMAPGGAPQERVYGLPWFAARYGVRTVIDAISAALIPFHNDLVDVTL